MKEKLKVSPKHIEGRLSMLADITLKSYSPSNVNQYPYREVVQFAE